MSFPTSSAQPPHLPGPNPAAPHFGLGHGGAVGDAGGGGVLAERFCFLGGGSEVGACGFSVIVAIFSVPLGCFSCF